MAFKNISSSTLNGRQHWLDKLVLRFKNKNVLKHAVKQRFLVNLYYKKDFSVVKSYNNFTVQ